MRDPGPHQLPPVPPTLVIVIGIGGDVVTAAAALDRAAASAGGSRGSGSKGGGGVCGGWRGPLWAEERIERAAHARVGVDSDVGHGAARPDSHQQPLAARTRLFRQIAPQLKDEYIIRIATS